MKSDNKITPQLPEKFYTDNAEIGELRVASEETLPKPEELVLREPETEKISIVLDKFALDFFRKKGKELGAPYQRMIRTLISDYVHKVTTR